MADDKHKEDINPRNTAKEPMHTPVPDTEPIKPDPYEKEEQAGQFNEFQQEIKGNSLTSDAWRRLKKNKMAVASLIVVIVYAFLSLFAPFLPIYSHTKIILEHQNLRPSLTQTAGELMYEKKEKELYAIAAKRADLGLSEEEEERVERLPVNQQFDYYYDLGKNQGMVTLSDRDQRSLDRLKEDIETELLFDIEDIEYIRSDGSTVKIDKMGVEEILQAYADLTGLEASVLMDQTDREVKEQIRKEVQIQNPGLTDKELEIFYQKTLDGMSESDMNDYYEENLEAKIIGFATRDANRQLKEVVESDSAEFPLTEIFTMDKLFEYEVEASKKHNRIYVFGTDYVGRDMLARIIYGGQISIMIGLIGTITSVIIGTILGALAGYIGGKTDYIIMRVVDVMYGLPYMLMVIIFMAVFGRNILNLFFALAIVSWLTVARVVRGQIISLKNSEFVEAAMSMGASTRRIVFKHLVPNSLGVIIVFSTLRIPAFIMLESFLSFLGLGVSAPMASWGSLIGDSVEGMNLYPWRMFFPAAAMSIFLFAMNFMGDGLRDAFDPQSKNQL